MPRPECPRHLKRVNFCRMRDAVELEVFKNIYHSIAEEMGAALRRTAFSPNIKERRDYSCAVFDGAGQVIAMGDHMRRARSISYQRYCTWQFGTFVNLRD